MSFMNGSWIELNWIRVGFGRAASRMKKVNTFWNSIKARSFMSYCKLRIKYFGAIKVIYLFAYLSYSDFRQSCILITNILSRIRFNAVWFGERPTFRRNISLSSPCRLLSQVSCLADSSTLKTERIHFSVTPYCLRTTRRTAQILYASQSPP
jgi:hypothetical protein